MREELEQVKESLRRLEEESRSRARKEASYGRIRSIMSRFTFGGYGEIHVNLGEGSEKDVIDIHRFVAAISYDFADWIRLRTEVELEHAIASDGRDGEFLIEQLFFDFYLSDGFNVRFGRILTPVGIVNSNHEPTIFNGVERPSFARVIIPTTWSSDGIGIFGDITDTLQYQLYLVGGLDGSGFNALNGIRGGRIKERPSLHEPSITGRLDFFPLLHSPVVPDYDLRVGASFFAGGLDNGNNGANPDVSADIAVYSADFSATCGIFDFRGVAALERIRDADEIGAGTASQIVGGYLEVAAHVLPESWGRGRLAQSDLVAFVRHDWLDTQNKLPSGVVRDDAGRRTEWTTGLGFFFTPGLVAKVDVQFRQDKTSNDLGTLVNFGLGWIF